MQCKKGKTFENPIIYGDNMTHLNTKLEMQWCVNKKVEEKPKEKKRVQMEKPKN